MSCGSRNREPGVTLEQIAADFGVHPITLSKWLRRADTDESAKPAPMSGESAELRGAGHGGGGQRQQEKRAREALRDLAATGFIVKIDPDSATYRLAEQ
ncbi:hypothetical protein [Streptomyces sp. NPDC048438]|uniref:hypothetical protein n=1 Tax=Streptomyces sp. NPDC048438 TaxID=3365551 RepID=UPI003723B4F5